MRFVPPAQFPPTTTPGVRHAPAGLFTTPEPTHATHVRMVKLPPPDELHARHALPARLPTTPKHDANSAPAGLFTTPPPTHAIYAVSLMRLPPDPDKLPAFFADPVTFPPPIKHNAKDASGEVLTLTYPLAESQPVIAIHVRRIELRLGTESSATHASPAQFPTPPKHNA